MVDVYPQCRFCEVEALCRKTGDECDVYHQYYGWEDKQDQPPVDTYNTGWINRFTGQVVEIARGEVMARITVQFGDNRITSVVPLDRLERDGIKEGDTMTAAVKAVNVTLVR